MMPQPSSGLTLSQDDWDEFIAVCYFGREGDWLDRCMVRAYLDMCRTLDGMGKFGAARPDWKVKMTELLKETLHVLTASSAWTQEAFNIWHKDCVTSLQNMSDVLGYGSQPTVEGSPSVQFTVGQAQKWINMSIKYAIALGEQRVSGFSGVYGVAHAPLDNIVLSALVEEAMLPLGMAWSRLNDYSKYMECQRSIRKLYPSDTALEAEYRIWLQATEDKTGESGASRS